MPLDCCVGRVRLVGAGPGPADLLTLRAAQALGDAQALLYDALVLDDVISLAPAACLKIQTGKRSGRASMKQETINRLMVRLARRGLTVVRLKGGDPNIFGRAGEELSYLQRHGIPVDVVPGVTAACAAAAQFKFPLTHRNTARRVVFTTARVVDGNLVGDWRVAADPEATAAIYMGGGSVDVIARRLVAAGRSPATPVMVVEKAGSENAHSQTMTLGSVQSLSPTIHDGPVLIVVGDVVDMALVDQRQALPEPRALSG